MTKTEEGAKPLLTLVADNSPETIAAQAEPETYSDVLAAIIQTLTKRKLAGGKIDLHETLGMLNPDEDNTVLRDWLVMNDITTKAGFDKVLARIARNIRITKELGFVPVDELDLVRGYAEHQKITLTPRGTITRARAYKVGDQQVDASNFGTSAETRLIYDVANATGDNLDSFGRELRLINSKLGLRFRHDTLGDAIQVWQEEVNRDAKINALLAIQFAKGRATGDVGTAMWEAMERACFDLSGTRPGFATAVIKKFMWQVKRKARGMSIPNHLMPVLTGAQGKGKTQFVTALTKPLHALMREVNFDMLTDGKTTDIWSSLILFIDEMGGFTRQDVDAVKNVITATDLTIRTMRQNHSSVIRNEATLIGCSNQSLDLLIRDNTGVRRFAELVWRNDPDWEASNALDWNLLWQSVDENDADPIVAANMVDVMREQQEANRNIHPVEQWARENAAGYKRWTRAADLFTSYRDWEQEASPRASTSLIHFGKLLSNFIKTMPDFPLEKQDSRNGKEYRAKGGAA